MIDAISKLVESGAISEDTQKAISDAWESKIKENKETVGAELREEFAKRYEHDKANMIEAIDKMMTEKLSEEITKFVEDRKALAQEKIAYKENVGKHSGKLEEFVLSKLTNELKELHADRQGVHENFKGNPFRMMCLCCECDYFGKLPTYDFNFFHKSINVFFQKSFSADENIGIGKRFRVMH